MLRVRCAAQVYAKLLQDKVLVLEGTMYRVLVEHDRAVNDEG
jgi:hypothetical protein